MLDAATSYGTLLWWPFSFRRVGWDWISIIDPIFTLTLLLGVGLAVWQRRAVPAQAALALAALYLGTGAVQRMRAAAAQQELARLRGHTLERAEVMPTFGNQVVWRALYLYEGRIYADRIRVGWASSARVMEGWSLPRVTAAELTVEEQALNRNRAFEHFAWFSEGWVARHPAEPTVLSDMRYSLSTQAFDPIWGIRLGGAASPAAVTWVTRSRERRLDLSELWREIAGRDERYQQLGARPSRGPASPAGVVSDRSPEKREPVLYPFQA